MSAHEGNRTVRRRRASLLRLPGRGRTVLAAIVLTAATAAAPAPAAEFADVTAALGITFRHDAAPSGDYELPEIMGAGMAIFDYNGDGALDLYFVGTAAHSGRLYRRGADGRYTDVTREARLQPRAVGMGTAVGDIDNDGDLDLYLTSVGPDQLYRNNGNGTFSDVSVQAGIEAQGWSSSATFCDIDADGYLDLFVGTYVSAAPSDARTCTTAAGQHDYCPPNVYPTQSDRLFRNMGDGSFTEVTDQSGIATRADPALGVVCADFDGTGSMDLYVANDGTPNHLWLNREGSTFAERGMQWGVANNLFGEAEAGMGVALGDTNADGLPDLLVTHIDRETHTLYTAIDSSEGTAAMMDATVASGLGVPTLPHTGFGVALADIDNDGYRDVAVANGRVRKAPGMATVGSGFTATYGEANFLAVNDGAGRFSSGCEDTSLCTSAEISRGLLAVDLDRDGDLDLVITNANGPARVFDNRTRRSGHWLSARLVDPSINRDAIGATLRVRAGKRWFVGTALHSASYLSSGPADVHLGLGDADAIDDLLVTWPGGTRERFTGPRVNQHIELRRGDGEPVAAP